MRKSIDEVIWLIEKALKEVIDRDISSQLIEIQETIDRIEDKIDVVYDYISNLDKL